MTPTHDLELSISGAAFGGKGVARHEGKVYFVPDTVPGDVVRARVVKDAGRYGDAEAIAFVSKSPVRGTPSCPYVEDCGGCSWQGIGYEQQLEWKKQFVVSSLSRIAKLGDDTPITMLGSPAVLGYRNRIHLKAEVSPDGELSVGYFRRQSRELVPIARCDIAESPINAFLTMLLTSSDRPALAAQAFKLEVQDLPRDGEESAERAVVVTLFPDREAPAGGLEPLGTWLRSRPEVKWCGMIMAADQAPYMLFEEHLGLRFFTKPGQFQQVNRPHNHTLRELVRAKVAEFAPRRVIDVFCGSGNLSLPLVSADCYVQGVENNPRAIDCAKYNLAANDLTNALYIHGDAEAHLWSAAKRGERFDLAIVDPPREGMYRALIPLKKLEARHILYVSCDPTTLARDLGALCKKDYRIRELYAFDFFPNTYHVESFAVLERVERAP